MKFEKFTNRLKVPQSRLGLMSLLSALFWVLAVGTVSAQCPLNCNNNVQVSLDSDCEVTITPAMILEGEGPSTCPYQVILKGPNGLPMSQPVVTGDHIGMTLEVEVRRTDNSNRCWGYITVEDKLPPVIQCDADTIFVDCYASASVPNPIVVENCGSFDLEVVRDDTHDLGCSDQYSAIRTIQYRATDESGNESEICTRIVAFTRIAIGDITFPLSYDDTPGNNPSLECVPDDGPNAPWDNGPGLDDNGEPFAGNGYPDPVETGAPMTPDGSLIYPNNSLCELNATFDDQVLPICESSFKVLRRWSVLDWCTGELEEEFQVIKIVDDEGPIAVAPQDNFMVSADPYSCTGDYEVQPPSVLFECGSWSYTVGYLEADATGGAPVNGLYIDDNVMEVAPGRFVIRDLPLGQTWIRYVLTDGCGNSSFAFTEVLVKDDVPPTPVCDENTVVTLNNDGVARIKAETFDDLSHDNCSDVRFDARRMTSGCGSGTSFDDYVHFCCADVGREIMVELRVWDDANGNGIYGDEINLIFDANGSGVLGDVVNGEPDLEVPCKDNYNTCMVNVTVQDKFDPVIICPDDITLNCGQDPFDMSITGDAVGADNCGTADIESSTSGDLDQCGVGVIRRRFTITDAGGRTDVCTQTITVINNNPFDFDDPNDLTWPSDVDLMGCQDSHLDPSETGEPIIGDDACSLVAATYNDQTFEFVDSACFKVIRTWSVIDWCQFDQNGSGDGIAQYVQVIKLNNNIAPTITGCGDFDACIFGNDCRGEVELIIDATDDCTPANELVYRYEIDGNSDGSIDFRGTGNNATRVLPTGVHTIYWTVEDMCGNISRDTCVVTVEDCKKPTPYCYSQINTVIMPSTGQIAIWATDYDLGSTDNCDGDLHFSFDEQGNQTSLTFDCTQLGINVFRLYVTDAAGNTDFCEVRIDIQSNGSCEGSTPPGIGGRIANESDEEVAEVMVQLETMANSEMKYYMTSDDGRFAFADLNPNDQQYRISAERNDYHGNGVSTLDLVLIQRHIIGLGQLDSPYKVIAADINNSGSVSGADVVELRRLILGITNEYDNNSSWRFVDADYQYTDPASPFPVRDYISVTADTQPQLDENMIAVKVGDVNSSHEVNLTSREDEVDTRQAPLAALVIDDAAFHAGEEVEVPFHLDAEAMIYGCQFTLTYDQDVLEYSHANGLSADQVHQVEPGVLAVAFDAASGLQLTAEDEMFTLAFEARASTRLSKALAMSSSVAKAEVYNQDLTALPLGLDVRGGVADITLMQNSPNPFADETYISFTLPEAMKATLSIFDVTGRVVKQYSNVYEQGVNTIVVEGDELGVQGVLYYQLEAEGYRTTKKMILLGK